LNANLKTVLAEHLRPIGKRKLLQWVGFSSGPMPDGAQLPSVRGNSLPIVIVGLFWLAVVVIATVCISGYANTPGQSGTPPASWPADSQVPRAAVKPTLLMFVHPKCPCSKASIGELAVLMAHHQRQVDAHVLFLKPAEASADYARTGTWRDAALIPGVTVHLDDAGREARLFASMTSGDTLLYDVDGRLAFHGGITVARGHAGDNAGRDGLEALLRGEPAERVITPVFGCGLFDSPTAVEKRTNACASCEKGVVLQR
jgi:hypothetical protein